MTNNRWNTQTVTCNAHTPPFTYSVTDGKPETCPACDRAAKMEQLNRVLQSNSDMKGKQ
jgi:hypothetical protein